MGYKYFQTDDRDDYFATLGGNGAANVPPTFKITKEGVVIHESILGSHAREWAKKEFDTTSKHVKCARWKIVATNAGYVVENLKTGHVGPDPNTKPLPVMCTCGRKMIIRTNSKDNSKFYGCPAFPRCRSTKPCNP
jgi:hypothetical protein